MDPALPGPPGGVAPGTRDAGRVTSISGDGHGDRLGSGAGGTQVTAVSYLPTPSLQRERPARLLPPEGQHLPSPPREPDSRSQRVPFASHTRDHMKGRSLIPAHLLKPVESRVALPVGPP